MFVLSKIFKRRSKLPYAPKNIPRANSLTSSCPIRYGGRAVATERILGLASLNGSAAELDFRVRGDLGVRFGLIAGVAEDVLREPLALPARPVDGRPALLLGHVPKPVDSHQFQVVGHLQKLLYPPPVLGDLHRRRDELDAHAYGGGGEPNVLDGRTHPEDGVEARELPRAVLRLVQKYR